MRDIFLNHEAVGNSVDVSSEFTTKTQFMGYEADSLKCEDFAAETGQTLLFKSQRRVVLKMVTEASEKHLVSMFRIEVGVLTQETKVLN